MMIWQLTMTMKCFFRDRNIAWQEAGGSWFWIVEVILGVFGYSTQFFLLWVIPVLHFRIQNLCNYRDVSQLLH